MHRAVFCPDPSMLPEAEELSRENFLPIVVGRSQRLVGLDFDDTTVSVILVPESHYVVLPNENVEAGIAWPIMYYNDFDDISHGCSVVVSTPSGETEEAQIVVSEKHYARFFYRPLTIGSFSVTVYVNGETKAEGGFFVC